MDNQRRADFKKSIIERLDTDTKRQDRLKRLAWLFEHLEEYLDRLLGFLAVVPLEDLLDTDVHTVLNVGVEITDQEQSALVGHDEFRQAWQAFTSVIREVNELPNDERSKTLKSKFEAARAALYE